MAEFRFYGVAEDVEGIFCSLSERGDVGFIPERSYPTPEYIVLNAVRTEAERELSQNRCWYLVGSFTKKPPYISKIVDNYYSMWLQYGGPVLQLIMPPLHRFDENGIRELVPGNLSHPREYWEKTTKTSYKVPDDVKAAYTDIIKTIKLHLVRRKFDQYLWIGKYAAKQLDEGKAIILSNGNWWDGKGKFIKFKPAIAKKQ
jgi:hypothetical protein